MSDALDAANAAISEIEKTRSSLKRIKTKQVAGAGERDHLKAVVFSWIKTHRAVVASYQPHPDLRVIDQTYTEILAATAKQSARSTYDTLLKSAKDALVAVRSSLLVVGPITITASADAPPSFATLAADKEMQDILARRWYECQRCMRVEAHLAATVMMGGLLEALFVAKANNMKDKSPLFKANATPKDKQTKKPIPLPDWTLRPYIDVGEELGWIPKSGKEVAAVLRDYRNYIHPEKERSHNVALAQFDSTLFWQITKLLAVQLLK